MWEDVLNLCDYVLTLQKICLQWQIYLRICGIKPALIHIKPAYHRIKPAEIVILRTCGIDPVGHNIKPVEHIIKPAYLPQPM